MLLVIKNYKKVITMNKQKILKLIKKNKITLINLEKSIKFAINNEKYMHKIINSAFTRTYDILNKREKEIKNILKLNTIEQKYSNEEQLKYNLDKTTNFTHQLILRLLLKIKLKPSEIINLKRLDIKENILKLNKKTIQLPEDILIDLNDLAKKETKYIFISNRNKKYNIRTIQKIRENYFIANPTNFQT
jgi:hypothetical protein